MSKNLIIKEQDLHAIVKDLMDKALAVDRPNKEKICKFVVNLVENGGNKSQAAYDAGYGPKKDGKGKIRTEKERRYLAKGDGHRLLTNADISAVYETLLSHRFLSTIFVQNITKAHLVSVLYQAGINGLNSERNFKSGIAAIKEVASMLGYLSEDSRRDADRVVDAKDEVVAAMGILPDLLEKAGISLDNRGMLN